MNNWVIQDTVTSTLYALSMNNGIFTITSPTTRFYRYPNVQDISTGIYYQISISNGILTYNSISWSGPNDTVYMYDSGLSQWFIIQITNGIFGQALSNPPSTIEQPSASGSGVRSKRVRVKKLYLEFDINGKKTYYWQWETVYLAGSKTKKIDFTKQVKATRLVPANLLISIEARRKYLEKLDLNILATKKASLEVLRNMKGIKMAPASNDYWCFYGTKVIPTSIEIEMQANIAKAIKKLKIIDYSILGIKGTNLVNQLTFSGNKIIKSTDKKILQGKRDITAILVALDLYE